MAKRNIITTPDTTNDDNIIIGLVTDIVSYMACYQISSIMNCHLSIHYYEDNESSDETIYFEYFKWSSETKGKKILVIPNIQSFDTFEKSPTSSLYANEIAITTKDYTLLPVWKHVKYIMRFEGYENKEIIDIAEKIRGSKKMQLVITNYASEIDNISVIYFFN